MTSDDDKDSPETGTMSARTGSHVPTPEPAKVTTAEYIEELEMLVSFCSCYIKFFLWRLLVGTDHGLVVMDTKNNVVTQMMATDSKLLSKQSKIL